MNNPEKSTKNNKNLIHDALYRKDKDAFKDAILKASEKDFIESVCQAASLEMFDFIMDFLPLKSKKINSLILEVATNSKKSHVEVIKKIIAHSDLYGLENAMINCSKMGHSDALEIIMEKTKNNKKFDNIIAYCMVRGARDGGVEVLKVVGNYINPKLITSRPLNEAVSNNDLESVKFIASFLKQKDYDIYMNAMGDGICISAWLCKNDIFDFLIKENVRTSSLTEALSRAIDNNNKYAIGKLCFKLSFDVIDGIYDQNKNNILREKRGWEHFEQIRSSLINKKVLSENIVKNNKPIKKRVI